MARKVVPNFLMFGATGCDMSVASTTSTVSNVQQQDNIGIQLSWTGTSPVGAIQIQCSNDFGTTSSPTWVALDFGAAISITGNTGTHTININQLPFSNIRAVYTKTSGVGTLTAAISAKSVGA